MDASNFCSYVCSARAFKNLFTHYSGIDVFNLKLIGMIMCNKPETLQAGITRSRKDIENYGYSNKTINKVYRQL